MLFIYYILHYSYSAIEERHLLTKELRKHLQLRANPTVDPPPQLNHIPTGSPGDANNFGAPAPSPVARTESTNRVVPVEESPKQQSPTEPQSPVVQSPVSPSITTRRPCLARPVHRAVQLPIDSDVEDNTTPPTHGTAVSSPRTRRLAPVRSHAADTLLVLVRAPICDLRP